MVPVTDSTQKEHIEAVKSLILNEVNVKALTYAEGENILVKKVKCNFRVMGKKFGKLMKAVAATMSNLSQEEIAAFECQGKYDFEIEGQQVTVDVADVEIISEDMPGWLVSNEGNLTVALEVELTPELKNEGMARELINRIQNMRKECGFEITDRIKITVEPQDEIAAAIAGFGDYVKTQVLADEIIVASNDGQPVDFDLFKINIKVEKA